MKRLLAAAAATILLAAQPAYAQSILRDAETESLFADMTAPLIKAAGLSPKNVKVVLVQDEEINAFTAGGQTIYVNSGLIEAADNANQVQGVIAHELGHVADGHVLLADQGTKPAMGIYILSLVLGVAAAAAGSPDAAAGILGAGQQAATGRFLSFSRTQESTADATGAKFLREAGITGRGMLDFFKKLQNQEYYYGATEKIDPFEQTHPLSSERIANLSADIENSPAYNTPPDPALNERFKRVKAKLIGYVAPWQTTLQKYPETDRSVEAHYARAYAWHKAGFPDKADAETRALIAAAPHDPYFLEIRGQILLEAGNPQASLEPLREATALSDNSPLIATTFGHALIATENTAYLPEAIKVLRAAVARDDENPAAWFELGMAYDHSGDQARAMLATAEQASINGDSKLAAYAARGAMQGLPPNTTDWIHAQDIAMTAQNDIDDSKKH
jgi:predicted Zn-dependent protease